MSLNHLTNSDVPFPNTVYLSPETGLKYSSPASTGASTGTIVNNDRVGFCVFSSLDPITDEQTFTMDNTHANSSSLVQWEIAGATGMGPGRVVKESYTAGSGVVLFTVCNTASSPSATGAAINIGYNIAS